MSIKEKILDIARRIWGTKGLIEWTKLNLYETRRYQLIEHIMNDTHHGISEKRYTDHEIIVSLTTYGKRIYDVAFTIESIMQQSYKPNRIVLWLDYSFENKTLPEYLLRQQKRGLEIRFCKDIRSFKKLIPSLYYYPDAAIITIDDDVLYDSDILEHLIIPYLTDPQYIYCNRFHKVTFDKKGLPRPYNNWHWCCNDVTPSHLNFFTGVGGVLYPPHSLDEEVMNESIFMDICQFADDIWFKVMAIKKGTMVKKVYSRSAKGEDYIVNENVQDTGLNKQNVNGEALNNKQLKAVLDHYNLYNLLK